MIKRLVLLTGILVISVTGQEHRSSHLEDAINTDVARVRNVAVMLLMDIPKEKQTPELLAVALQVSAQIVSEANSREKGESQ